MENFLSRLIQMLDLQNNEMILTLQRYWNQGMENPPILFGALAGVILLVTLPIVLLAKRKNKKASITSEWEQDRSVFDGPGFSNEMPEPVLDKDIEATSLNFNRSLSQEISADHLQEIAKGQGSASSKGDDIYSSAIHKNLGPISPMAADPEENKIKDENTIDLESEPLASHEDESNGPLEGEINLMSDTHLEELDEGSEELAPMLGFDQSDFLTFNESDSITEEDSKEDAGIADIDFSDEIENTIADIENTLENFHENPEEAEGAPVIKDNLESEPPLELDSSSSDEVEEISLSQDEDQPAETLKIEKESTEEEISLETFSEQEDDSETEEPVISLENFASHEDSNLIDLEADATSPATDDEKSIETEPGELIIEDNLNIEEETRTGDKADALVEEVSVDEQPSKDPAPKSGWKSIIDGPIFETIGSSNSSLLINKNTSEETNQDEETEETTVAEPVAAEGSTSDTPPPPPTKSPRDVMDRLLKFQERLEKRIESLSTDEQTAPQASSDEKKVFEVVDMKNPDNNTDPKSKKYQEMMQSYFLTNKDKES